MGGGRATLFHYREKVKLGCRTTIQKPISKGRGRLTMNKKGVIMISLCKEEGLIWIWKRDVKEKRRGKQIRWEKEEVSSIWKERIVLLWEKKKPRIKQERKKKREQPFKERGEGYPPLVAARREKSLSQGGGKGKGGPLNGWKISNSKMKKKEEERILSREKREGEEERQIVSWQIDGG